MRFNIYLAGLGCSDHVYLSFKFMCYAVQEPGNNRRKYNLRHADFETMREMLSYVDWHDSLTPLSIHEQGRRNRSGQSGHGLTSFGNSTFKKTSSYRTDQLKSAISQSSFL